MGKRNRNMARNPSDATELLSKEYMQILKEPVPFITAHPLPSDMFEWHFAISGPPESSYSGGIYHGKIVFPQNFPQGAPSIFMMTPSGRFAIHKKLGIFQKNNSDKQLRWSGTPSVSRILYCILALMLDRKPVDGYAISSCKVKKDLAKRSWKTNLKDSTFCELFPDLASQCHQKAKEFESSSVRDKSPNPSETAQGNNTAATAAEEEQHLEKDGNAGDGLIKEVRTRENSDEDYDDDNYDEEGEEVDEDDVYKDSDEMDAMDRVQSDDEPTLKDFAISVFIIGLILWCIYYCNSR